MIYNATHDTTGEEEAMMNDLIAQIPDVERILQEEEEEAIKPILSRVIEFIASRSYHIGYEHGQKDSGIYIAKPQSQPNSKTTHEACPECGGMGFTVGFIGQQKHKFTCSTCTKLNAQSGESE